VKYTIENKDTGIVMIRLFIPEYQVPSFLAFIDQKSIEKPPVIRSVSRPLSENYLIELASYCATSYNSFVLAGLPKNSAISETLKKIKIGQYHNVSYDQLKAILTKKGCFRSK
jgi:hypothetical protein